MHKHTMEVVADRSIINECQGMKLLSFYLSVSALSLYPYVKDKSGVIPVHRHHERNQNGTWLHTRFVDLNFKLKTIDREYTGFGMITHCRSGIKDHVLDSLPSIADMVVGHSWFDYYKTDHHTKGNYQEDNYSVIILNSVDHCKTTSFCDNMMTKALLLCNDWIYKKEDYLYAMMNKFPFYDQQNQIVN
ncbi:2810_t:CDS:2 [Paraglomus brasilianum]|uniref:2810_t:CDS:1 n=1 Tax=Paraglomus brasilianum TaxID=144538 RepID=A0A9N8Z524_9GLOM|nr:2810_t:CDS:2 [Paraglomus brasilianum]